jgi:hypothetical protein
MRLGLRGKIGAARDRRLDWVANGPSDASTKSELQLTSQLAP